MKSIKLSDDASVWYLLWSNQAAILTALVTIQGALPYWEGVIPRQWFVIAGAVLSTSILVLRSVEQPKAKAKLEAKRDQLP